VLNLDSVVVIIAFSYDFVIWDVEFLSRNAAEISVEIRGICDLKVKSMIKSVFGKFNRLKVEKSQLSPIFVIFGQERDLMLELEFHEINSSMVFRR
jgi:hypothetical protein